MVNIIADAVAQVVQGLKAVQVGTRTPKPRRRQKRPEDRINEFAITLAAIGKIVSGLGFLALTWSTVVLLGGFVSALQLKEFWFLTTVSLVLASTILAIYDYDNDSALEAVPNSFLRLLSGISRIMDNDGRFVCFNIICGYICSPLLKAVSLLILGLIEVALIINLIGPMVSMVISMIRLIQHDYDGSDAANKGKLRAALFIFYCLTLVHGVCFYFWLVLRTFLDRQFRLVSEKCKFGEWGPEVVRGYYKETRLKCANDLRLPTGWNLVAYAVGLLQLDSVSRDDNLSGVRILDTCVDWSYRPRGVPFRETRCIRLELSSSRRAIQNLITMLAWTSSILEIRDQEITDQEIRALQEITVQEIIELQEITDKEIRELQEIRERAARIMADISSELHIARFPGALQSVSSLLQASPQKRHQEALGLSEQGSEQSSHITGTTQENTTDSTQRKSQLVRVLLSTLWSWILWMSTSPNRMEERRRERTRRKEEERAFKPKGANELILQGLLIIGRLAYDEHNCREIVNTPGLLSKITAPITSQAFLDADYDDTLLRILSSSLSVVRRLISVRAIKLIDASDSCFVVLVDGVLIKKLKDIIERNKNTTADRVRTVKLTCQVVIAMMQLKPSCIKEFNEHNFKEVLSEALKTLSDLDNRMLLDRNDGQLTKPARSLASLVEEARQFFNEAQEPGNNSA